MSKSYFCWERTVGMRWMPTLYATHKPSPLIGYSKDDPPRRSTVYEVDADAKLDDLIKQYPAPPHD